MRTVKLPGAEDYDSHMEMHTSTTNTDISLARESQKHISDPTRAHDLLDHGNDRNFSSNGKWTECEYHSQYRKMCHTYQLKFYGQQLIHHNCNFAVRMKNLMEGEG